MSLRVALAGAAVSALTGTGAATLVVTPGATEDVRRVETAALALDAGLSPDDAVTATAIAEAESHHRDAAEGDTTITDGEWGPSYGRWQIRCMWSQVGTGGTRDCNRLDDPKFNAASMVQVSGGGENWRPWSVYLHDLYQPYLPAAREAVAQVSGVTEVVAGSPVGPPVQGVTVERTPKRLGMNLWRMVVDGWTAIGGSSNPEVRSKWQDMDRELFGVQPEPAPRPLT